MFRIAGFQGQENLESEFDKMVARLRLEARDGNVNIRLTGTRRVDDSIRRVSAATEPQDARTRS